MKLITSLTTKEFRSIDQESEGFLETRPLIQDQTNIVGIVADATKKADTALINPHIDWISICWKSANIPSKWLKEMIANQDAIVIAYHFIENANNLINLWKIPAVDGSKSLVSIHADTPINVAIEIAHIVAVKAMIPVTKADHVTNLVIVIALACINAMGLNPCCINKDLLKKFLKPIHLNIILMTTLSV